MARRGVILCVFFFRQQKTLEQHNSIFALSVIFRLVSDPGVAVDSWKAGWKGIQFSARRPVSERPGPHGLAFRRWAGAWQESNHRLALLWNDKVLWVFAQRTQPQDRSVSAETWRYPYFGGMHSGTMEGKQFLWSFMPWMLYRAFGVWKCIGNYYWLINSHPIFASCNMWTLNNFRANKCKELICTRRYWQKSARNASFLCFASSLACFTSSTGYRPILMCNIAAWIWLSATSTRPSDSTSPVLTPIRHRPPLSPDPRPSPPRRRAHLTPPWRCHRPHPKAKSWCWMAVTLARVQPTVLIRIWTLRWTPPPL